LNQQEFVRFDEHLLVLLAVAGVAFGAVVWSVKRAKQSSELGRWPKRFGSRVAPWLFPLGKTNKEIWRNVTRTVSKILRSMRWSHEKDLQL